MRVEAWRDKEVIGGGFVQLEKDCQATVYSSPIFIQDFAEDHQPALSIFSMCRSFHYNQKEKVKM